MNVVAYARYSSEQQRDGYSIEAQISAIKKYCEDNKYELLHIYIDEARSATSDDREQFQNMIQDSAKKNFEAVIVHKLDRFSRDGDDYVLYKVALKKNNVRILSVLENLEEDTPETALMERVYVAISEFHSKNLARESLKGKRIAASQGKYLGGVIPYGYAINDDKKFVVVEHEALIVKTIFDMVASGSSFNSVAKWLHTKGVTLRGRNVITYQAISYLLKNPIYKGTYNFGNTHSAKDPGKAILIDDMIEPIVTKQRWEEVAAICQEKKETQKSRPRLREADYSLTNYIYCGKCGSHLKGHKMSRNKKDGTQRIIYYYRCAKNVKDHRKIAQGDYSIQCKCKLVQKDAIESYVIKYIEDVIFNPNRLDKIIAGVKNVMHKPASKNPSAKKKIEAEVTKIKAQEEKLLDLYLDGNLEKEIYNKRKDELKERKMIFISKLDSYKIEKEAKPFNAESVKKSIEGFTNSKNNENYDRSIIMNFVKRITVYDDYIDLEFKINLLPSKRVFKEEVVQTIM